MLARRFSPQKIWEIRESFIRSRAGTSRLGEHNCLVFREFDIIRGVFAALEIRGVFRTRGDPGVAWTIEFGLAKIDRFSWECAP